MTDIVGSRTLRSQWDETARLYAGQTFLHYISVQDTDTLFTYAEFDAMVRRAANFFLELGIRKGELVALHLHNTPEYLVCWLALAQIGAVSVPLNEHYRLPESEYVLQTCEIRRIIVEPESAAIYTENRQALGLDTIILARGRTDAPDVLLLAEIFAAREKNTIGISSAALAERVEGAEFYPTFPELEAELKRKAQPGDIILTVGAGDVYKIGENIVE